MSYTINEVRAEMIRSHGGKKMEFALDQIQQWGFPFDLSTDFPPNGFIKFRGTDRGIYIAPYAISVSEAAKWAVDALREWAFNGIRRRGTGIGGRNYFGRITRRWAKYGPGSGTPPGSLGNTLDWLYMFSQDASRNPSDDMYPVFGYREDDLFNIYCWVYSDLWAAHTGLDVPRVNIPSSRGLHRAFWDSDPRTDEEDHKKKDQTHHFAAFFWLGANFGDSEAAVMAASTELEDAALDPGEASGFRIINGGDVLLGFLAAQWGNRMRSSPGYLGNQIARSLQSNCGWPHDGPQCGN